MEDSNPSYSRVVQSNSEVDVLLVHVGKCAGGTVITTLRSLFPACNVKIWHYHVHDSRHLLSRVIDLQEQKANLLVLMLTRDPLARFISAYNWDYCLHVLQRTPYSQFKIDKWYQKYPSARELIRALAGNSTCDEAIRFARYKHYAYGHMRMGISWYLSIDLLKELNPFRTFCIRVEHINEDLPSFVRHLEDVSGFKIRKELRVRHDKSDYARLFPSNLLRIDSSRDALTDTEIDRMKLFLSEDYKCHEYASEKFIRAILP